MQRFYMRFFGHPTAKPTKVLSNSSKIIMLDHGPMKKEQLSSEVKTTVKKIGKDGRVHYQGSPHLKGTQLPVNIHS